MSNFPLNPTIGDEYNGYSWDGTSWNLIGNKFNPSSFSATAPENPKPGDIWIDSSTDVGAVSPESLLTKTEAQSTYYTKALSDELYASNFTVSYYYATKEYADTAATNAVNSLIDTAPANLDTLNELAAALNDDANFASTVTTSLSNKQDKVTGVSDTEIGYLDGVTSGIQSQINAKLDAIIASNTYLTQSSASSTYLTQINASSTYALKTLPVVEKTSSTTLSISDANSIISANSSSNITVTIPPNSSVPFPIGTQIIIVQTGTGSVTLLNGSGVSSNKGGASLSTRYSSFLLIKVGINSWSANGDISV